MVFISIEGRPRGEKLLQSRRDKRIDNIQFWIFLRVNDGGDRDAKIRDWAPKICNGVILVENS